MILVIVLALPALTIAPLVSAQEGDADAALAPDAVQFPGIEYQAQGF